MTNPNKLHEFIHNSIQLRRHPYYPMFAVSEDGQILGTRGFLLNPHQQASGHLYLNYYDADRKQCYIHAHRLIALCYVSNPDPATLIKVDHIDTNPENNHYTNLRWVTARQNCQNLAKNKNGTTSSQYVGVSWKKREQKFAAQIRLDGKNKGLGLFKEAVDAARAYDQALVEAGLAKVNFLSAKE